ncbi:Equilibrative nucleotide transporter 1 [Heracleum sosnowskyi]|uniref:Equilibrative nucleotide transporter 1 n=1 Tax=Heracleum sosnowskyi TaxID=360622 RepID=A0AAD8JGI4_9APIA|nr:Equilibrative nucleotide transporter 1 [Heracleum sosnowskyi]
MIICIVLYNIVHKLPVIKYYNDIKLQALDEEKEKNRASTSVLWGSKLWENVGTVKWYGYGILVIYVMTLCIFPGYITEDVHSYILNDWYPILLITGFNVFDVVGKSLTAIYVLENAKVAIGASFARLFLLPLFYGCLHGPQFFGTEIPVTALTCLLGLTNGYLTSVLMILGTKTVQVQHAETAGIVLVIFLVTGLSIGSVVSWFWVI